MIIFPDSCTCGGRMLSTEHRSYRRCDTCQDIWHLAYEGGPWYNIGVAYNAGPTVSMEKITLLENDPKPLYEALQRMDSLPPDRAYEWHTEPLWTIGEDV